MVTIPMDAHQCKNVKLTDVFFSGPPKSPKSHVQDQLMNGILFGVPKLRGGREVGTAEDPGVPADTASGRGWQTHTWQL